MSVRRQQYSNSFKFKYVMIYEKIKHIKSLNSFVKTISGKDGKNDIFKGKFDIVLIDLLNICYFKR